VKLGMNMLLWSTDVCGREHDATFAMLKDAGFDVDASDASSLRSMVPPHELSDNDLERIAGGAGGAVTSGGGAGFIVGASAAAAAA